MKQSIFNVKKMDCPSEEQLIRRRLENFPGIVALDFDIMRRELKIRHETSEQKLLDALMPLQLDVSIKAECESCELPMAASAPAISRKTWLLLGVSGVTAISSEIIAWASGDPRSWIILALALVSIATGGVETLKKGWIALRTFTLNINFLMTVAIIGAMAIGEWPEAAIVIFLFAVAELIESLSIERARNAIRELMTMSPETATVLSESGQWQEVDAGSVNVGATVRVRPGERIPLDGLITVGESSVNQAPITGESMPVDKKPGDPVFAGTLNENGLFEFRVTANKGSSTLARIIRTVQEAQATRAPTQRFVDQFARYYTPAVFVVALLVALIPPLFFAQAFIPWLYKALVLLVIACPCALVISTPVTVVSGLAAAARAGILVKGGAYLEQARHIKIVALDKTGTLTVGKPSVTDIVTLSEFSEHELLRLAAGLDVHSDHPVARAIVAAWTAGNAGDALPQVASFAAIPGRAVEGMIDGKRYWIGNHRLLQERGLATATLDSRLDTLEQSGKTATILADDATALGIIAVADTLRESSVAAVAALHALGIRTIMLTGDNAGTAHAIAKASGIDEVQANVLPEEKLAVIEGLVGQYDKVAMVGDGINDAPALAKASVGFAMGAAGSDTAIETADVALMQDDLRKLPQFIELSRATGRILWQNITLALGIKAVFFALALTGNATLWMAVFADMGASLIVVFNGMRLARHTHQQP